MKPRLKKPELLLAAAALLIAAAALLAAGAINARDKPDLTAQTSQSAPASPFEQATADASIPTGQTGGGYVVGYTGVIVIPPEVTTPQPNTGQTAPPQTLPPPAASYPVNLNTADQTALETLPGIGPVKAQAILSWRAANGGFNNANQLLEINGIGQKTLESLLPYITW